MDKSNNKERICIYLAIDPKGQHDLQCHMIFDMTSKSYGLLWGQGQGQCIFFLYCLICRFIHPHILDRVTLNFQVRLLKKETSGWRGITSSIYLDWNISIIYCRFEIKLILVKAEWRWLLVHKKNPTFLCHFRSRRHGVIKFLIADISLIFYVGICHNLVWQIWVQGDLQGHMIFYMRSNSHGLPRSLWPNCGSIWRKIREISAIESLMTSCMRDRKWRRKLLLRNKRHRHSAFTKISLISIRQWITEFFQFKYIDDVIPR